MKYKNIKTGAIVYSSSKILGKNWQEVTEEEVKEEVKETVKVVKEKAEETEETENISEDFDGVTKKQIMQELDAMGIEYDPRAKKQELYDLMVGE